MSENQQHTPGPWRVIIGHRTGGAVRIEAPNDRGIPGAVGSVVRQNGIGMPCSEIGKANARLIAAAPDLLAALHNTLTLLKVFTRETDDVAKAAWDEAEAAIAKATGQSHPTER